MINVYFDTEFCGLKKSTDLISIGLVTEEGKTFYGEFSDFDQSVYADPWLKSNVLNNTVYLKDGVPNTVHVGSPDSDHQIIFGSKDMIRNCLEQFLESIRGKEDIQLVSDVCHYDMVLFIDIFKDAFHLPDFISPCCVELNQMIAKYYNITGYEAFDKNREGILKEHGIPLPTTSIGDKHNSLFDAKVIYEIYKIVTKKQE